MLDDADVLAASEVAIADAVANRKFLEAAQQVRASAKAKAKESRLDEEVLWTEWINDVLDEWRDTEAFAGADGKTVRDDPGAAYLRWLEERLRNPFRVPARIVQATCRKLGATKGMHLALVLWGQEVAWAQRRRRSDDQELAVLSHIFVLAAMKDPAKTFTRLSAYYDDAMLVLSYAHAPEHRYQPWQIRAGMGAEDFVPVYMRFARSELAGNVERLTRQELAAAAKSARELEEAEMRDEVRNRVLTSLAGVTLSRLTGVISVGLQCGLGADDLIHAESLFVAAISAGKVPIPVDTRLPYPQFISWLRVGNFKAKEKAATLPDRRRELKLLTSRPRRWQQELPSEYQELGAGDPDLFHRWIQPIVGGERVIPEDLVVDYGLFLVANSFEGIH